MSQRETLLGRRIAQRDASLRRLRRTTAMSLAGASALAVAFGGLAAKSFTGHKGVSAEPSAVALVRGGHAVRDAGTARVVAHPPVLVPVSAPAPAPPPAAPTPPPVATQVAPVAVSGGS